MPNFAEKFLILLLLTSFVENCVVGIIKNIKLL